MKKLIPNPDYEKAKFSEGFIWRDGTIGKNIPEVRTNNPNYLVDGCKESDRIPSHIEVDE